MLASPVPARRAPRAAGRGAPASSNGRRAELGDRSGQLVLPRIEEIQRARILDAMVAVTVELGSGSVTVAHVVERSGVSRRTFYENFEDREDCLLASFERALTLASQRVIPAYESETGWRERMRAGLVALLAFCDEQPSVARMLVCESLTSGGRVAERRAEILARLTRIVDQGRTLTGAPEARIPRGHAAAGESGKAENISPLAAEGTIGGVLAVIQARLTEGKRTQRAHTQRAHGGKPLIPLTNELMSMIVLPYMGAGAARRELDRPVPASVGAPGEDALISDPFKEAGMRLTYRTVRVLMAIAQQPDGSNRMIGETAGITDQGQISKLLNRLERIGLVQNTGVSPGKGAPNAWTLTPSGRQVADSIRMHTEGSQNHAGHER
ncbi:MAG TPA: TetR family transcriptional regulator [Solirubrobacteraceae bacterium]|nr:TetR family transcriptional regulator [Solirubrobacteraceae bacterium]